MNDKRKEGTAFSSKSISVILKIFTLAALIVPCVIFFGNNYWFAKSKGEAIEKRQVIIESDSKHRDDMIMKEQHHMHEKLDDMRVEQKEDMSEMKGLIIDYLNSTRVR